MMRNRILFTIIPLLLFGCTIQPQEVQIPSISPEKTDFPTLDGFSIRQTERVATVIALKTASQTPFPTREDDFPITTPSLVPTSTPSGPKAYYSKACQDEFSNKHTKISPDGIWLAESCSSDGIMQVSNHDGSKKFVVNSMDFFSDPLFPELIGSVTPVHWTKDSQFIYFTVTPEQWNDGGFLALDSFAPLLGQINIQNGETSRIFSGTVYHSFSPTDRRLIEVQQFEHPIKLIVHDLKTGSSQMLLPENNSKYSQAAKVVWSPDGLKFIFVAAFGGEYGDEVEEPIVQSLILVDLNDLSQQTIISEIPNFIEPISWDGNDDIVYRIMNYDDTYQIKTYTYNYQNKQTTSLPTTTP